MSVIFYTNPMSRGRIARWMLEETGAPYDVRYLRYGPEMQAPDYAAINPMRKVPAIVHEGHVVTECGAICAYLAEAFPEAGLAPLAAERAAYFRWMFFAAGPWEAASTNQAIGLAVPEEHAGMVGYGDFARTLTALTGAVARGPYLCGDRFTAADVYFGAQISWGVQFGTIPKTPEVEAYLARILSRPAYLNAGALDDAAMAEYGPGG
ncbi:glutathione S-transferase family protein [Hyphomonas sp.]|uniref:glutathione S-transferase family protein n=1 Tax=Hyphomonas sp. TaxID=87 RepID=UPI00391BD114